MAKNIVIAEGGTAKNFTAKKLQTNLQGSGRVNWIPEDEAVDYVNLKDHTFRAAGTFNPSDFNCDGFRQVKIDIPADVKPKTITKNGEFYAADDNCLGYSKVTVAVPTGGGGGPYTVRFFGDDYETILKTDANVPYGGSATCTELDGTILNGLYFKGWNPSPVNVREDMNCYPVRGDYVIDPNEIQDDWETICADAGAHYPLGAYKSLVVSVPARSEVASVTIPTTNDGVYETGHNFSNLLTNAAINIAMHMVKVAEGEDGTTSSWLSTGVIPVRPYWNGNRGSVDYTSADGAYLITNVMKVSTGSTDGSNIMTDGGNSVQREYLNNYLLNQLPSVLAQTIKEVNKAYTTYNILPYHNYSYTNSGTKVEKTSLEKIWIPSARELKTYLETFNDYDNLLQNAEYSGIDYTSVYVPSYPDKFLTRTMMKKSSVRVNCITKVGGNVNIETSGTPGCPIGFCL